MDPVPRLVAPPASFHSPVSFRPGTEDDYSGLKLPPIVPISSSSTSKAQVGSLYHHYREVEEFCESCTALDIISWVRCEYPKRSWWGGIRIGTFAQLQRRTSCLFCSTVYRALKLEIPYDMFSKCFNQSLTLSRDPGRWQRDLTLKDGFRSPGVCLRLWPGSLDGEPWEFTARFDIIYNTLVVKDSTVKLRQLSSLDLQFGMADFNLIKSWLLACDGDHGESCGLERNHLSSSLDIHLIDVTTRSIISAKANTRYVALSYVWGPVHDAGNKLTQLAIPSVSPRRLPKFLPSRVAQTVEDAISVVGRLGESFLWVDAYCIDQYDPLERDHMIKSMHHIYECAILTICAISGTSSDSGLPGISHPLNRGPQCSTSTPSGTLLVRSASGMRTDLQNSPWLTRGWTLQESVLSRLRLCFGSSGVFLWCQKELFHEVALLETDSRRRDFEPTFNDRPALAPFSFEPIAINNWSFRSYTRLVDAYTSRTLSVDSDASRALAGMLNKITDETRKQFTYGLPAEDIVSSLLWEGECWSRRTDFPSWSWLGWRGTAKYESWLNKDERTIVSIDERKFYKPFGYWLPSNIYIEITFSAGVVRLNDDGRLGSLVLHSSSASFKVFLSVRKGEQYLGRCTDNNPDGWWTSDQDQWELRDDAANSIYRDTIYIPDQASGENCSFEAGQSISSRLTQSGVDQLEFILLQRWTEVDPDHLEKEVFCAYGDRVWLMALFPNPDGTMERAGILTLPYRHWLAANPRVSTVCLV